MCAIEREKELGPAGSSEVDRSCNNSKEEANECKLGQEKRKKERMCTKIFHSAADQKDCREAQKLRLADLPNDAADIGPLRFPPSMHWASTADVLSTTAAHESGCERTQPEQ